ncbi:TPA: DedA family protein, partial [Neisseria meningitidis]
MMPAYAYAALAFSAFTSATLLPGTSEAAFALFVHRFPEHAYGALLCAGLANG